MEGEEGCKQGALGFGRGCAVGALLGGGLRARRGRRDSVSLDREDPSRNVKDTAIYGSEAWERNLVPQDINSN